MYNLQKQAKSIKKELKNIHIESEMEGVKVTLSGEQEVLSVELSESAFQTGLHNKKTLEGALLKALNKALKKAQEIGAAKMKGVWGELGIPGK